ncbi:hypothetical protein GPECTOR_45g105 [Gonium pectorale]|uniref:Kinesin motor domain-containing protein n=1 Tax=Gonium pectorale TaxID=33097 RepID=A0A150G9J9_GONPE|nr:hypothetical protein GPECTOR_45g105 [Gonium pectorale]|eukprot:KXZ46235.1 hypothetical protein GPECTOR_45g105 [Gonium pectorale]
MSVNTQKRSFASEFIHQTTGLHVPYSNDLNFRQALRDGIILCKILNRVKPNAVQLQSGPDSGLANVQAFLGHITEHMHFPSEARFSLHDLLSEDYDDRPRIVDCILWLKKLHSGYDPTPSPFARDLSDVRAVRDSPRKAQVPAALASAFSNLSNPPPQQTALVPTGPRTMAAVQPNATLAALCTDISNTLMSRLSPGAPVPTQKYDMVVSNVMEQFLSGLTVEYERRLMAKDQELYSSKDALARLQKQFDSMQAELNAISAEMAEQRRNEAKVSEEVVERLRAEMVQVERLLAERTQALEAAQAALGGNDEQRSEREAELQAQLAAALTEIDSVADLRERFARIQKENRDLYNEVQDLKGSIRVFCRVRPCGTTGDSAPSCLDVGLDGELAVFTDKPGDHKIFKYDKIFDGSSSQVAVYEHLEGLVRSVMDGFNVCIFAYGQTGSGKTHTMTGSRVPGDLEGRGVNYRALDDLFQLANTRSGEVRYSMRAQMLEIYNETIQDLLTDYPPGTREYKLLATKPSGQNVTNITQLAVECSEDVVAMMEKGEKNRKTAATQMNSDSSRSHQILTVIVEGENIITGARTSACLHLIDLAGSERTDKSLVEGDRMKEANAINTSLSALGTVMHNLAAKSKHVPFRNSKLTELLADSLSGQAKVCMLMHVAPENSSRGETLSTLNFGNRVASVTLGQAKANVESGRVFEAHEALARKERETAELKEQLRLYREQNAMLRAQLSAQCDMAPPLSARSESFRTANTHMPPDSAASTPASRIRPSITTPRGPAVYGTVQNLEHQIQAQTPRFGRPAAMTPRTSSGAQTARNMPTHDGSLRGSAASTSEQQDRLGPLTRNTTVANKPGNGRGVAIPRLDTASAKAAGLSSGISGSMSARPSAKYGAPSSSGGYGANSSSNQPARPANHRPATSRTSNVYGSANAFSGPVSRSSSVILPEGSLGNTLKRPPMSSRPGSGWK